MAKAKKKTKKPARRKATPAPPPGLPRAILSDLVHRGPVPETSFQSAKLSLPELWPKIERTEVVRFLEKMRADTAPAVPGGRKRPAMLARVADVGDGAHEKDLAMSAPLAAVFAVVPLDGYVGRTYRITRHRKHERKNAAGYTVEEIPAADGN